MRHFQKVEKFQEKHGEISNLGNIKYAFISTCIHYSKYTNEMEKIQ